MAAALPAAAEADARFPRAPPPTPLPAINSSRSRSRHAPRHATARLLRLLPLFITIPPAAAGSNPSPLACLLACSNPQPDELGRSPPRPVVRDPGRPRFGAVGLLLCCWVGAAPLRMGNCWGARIKDGSTHPGPSGMSSRSSGKDGSRLSACSSRASSASMPPSAKTECEILQSANVKVFSYNDLRLATRNFRPDSVLGEGGFGSVYKGWIDEHTLSACKPGTGIPVAVKRLNQEGLQGHREWLAEVNYLGQFCHPNLVKLIGYCLEDEYRLLVYECMPRGSLENHLFRRGSHFQPLSWNLRMKVALGAAKGLAYLHSAEAKVIYRDFKTSNILLDTDYTAKLSDFGLAKDGPVGEKSHVSTRVMGTYGYAAPEYLSTGHLTAKSDIYSFGVVLLEMLSGRRAIDKNRPQGEHNLVEWARPHLTHKRKIFRVLDTRLEGQYSLSGAQTIAALAVECLNFEAKMRPSMDAVVSILEGIQDSSDPTRKPAAERHQDAKGAGKKMTSASVGRNSGKPRRKSSNDLQKDAGRDPKMSVLHSS